MKITIKNLKIAKFASEETLCFEATVYVDGEKAFTAHNDGRGGCDMYHPIGERGKELLEKAEAWAKAQPKIVDDKLMDGGKPFEYQPDLEHYVQEAITVVEIERDVKKITKNTLAGFVGTDLFTWKISPQHPQAREKIKEKHPSVQFLNDMPLDKAVAAYRQGHA